MVFPIHSKRRRGVGKAALSVWLLSFAHSLISYFYFNPSLPVPYVCYLYILVLSSPLVSYFCDWAVFTLSGGEQLGLQHPAKCYSSSLMFRPTSIVAGWCTRPFLYILEGICPRCQEDDETAIHFLLRCPKWE